MKKNGKIRKFEKWGKMRKIPLITKKKGKIRKEKNENKTINEEKWKKKEIKK